MPASRKLSDCLRKVRHRETDHWRAREVLLARILLAEDLDMLVRLGMDEPEPQHVLVEPAKASARSVRVPLQPIPVLLLGDVSPWLSLSPGVAVACDRVIAAESDPAAQQIPVARPGSAQ